MTNPRPLYALCLCLALAAGGPRPAAAAPELLDRIVAVVDDQVVLWSELNLRTQLDLQAQGRNPLYLAESELAAERRRILDDMVDELVVVKKAQKDSLEVESARVQEVLDAEFGRIKRNMGDAELADMLERSGLSERQLKQRYRQQIRNRLLYEQMVSELAYRLFITRRDVEAFRERYDDSLPAQISISQIVLEVTPADSVLEEALARMEQIRAELDAGRDFGAVARQFSEDPGTRGQGGDLGCFGPGTLMPEFERTAMELRPGQVSEPVLTPYGYHLIQLHEKREQELCASHILVRARTTGQDQERVRERLDQLRQRALAGEDFAQLARDNSDDPVSARQGGLWQILERQSLPAILEPHFAGLGLGGITEPFFLESLGRIMKVNDDYATLESLVREERVGGRMTEVIEAFREEIHVEERLDEDWLWDPLKAGAASASPPTSARLP